MSQGNQWDPLPPSGQFPPGGGNHYQPNYGPQPSSGGRVLLWVLGIFGALTLLLLVICCGLGFFGFRTFQNEFSRGVTDQVRNSPEIVQHIGEIEQVELNFSGMSNPDEAGMMVLNVRGTKGTGKLSVNPTLIESDPQNAYVLILADGQRIPLTGLGEAASDPAPPVDNAAEGAAPPPAEPSPVDPASAEPAAPTEPVDEVPPAASPEPTPAGDAS